MNVGNNAHGKTGAQPFFNLYFLWGTVAAENNLLVRKVQLVESVENFLLRAFLVCQKLHVVHHQHVKFAVLVPEHLFGVGVGCVVKRLDKFVHKLVAGNVHYLFFGVVALQTVSYCVHQVGFSKTHSSPQKHGIVLGAGIVRHRPCHRFGVLVAFAHNKVFKGVLRNEVGFFFHYGNVVGADGNVHFLFHVAYVGKILFRDNFYVHNGRENDVGATAQNVLVIVVHNVFHCPCFGKQNKPVVVQPDRLKCVDVQIVNKRLYLCFRFQQNVVPNLIQFQHSTFIIHFVGKFCNDKTLFLPSKYFWQGESIAVHLSYFPFDCFSSNFPLQKRYILRKRAGVRWKIFVSMHVFANFARKIIQTPFRRCRLQTPDILPFYRLQSFLLFKMHFVCWQRRFFPLRCFKTQRNV